uniref:Uncharacterized protein n=1 Tax=Arundo donax TaxID=35708 RepID=A0A0A8YNR4_ARUDO
MNHKINNIFIYSNGTCSMKHRACNAV